MTRMFVPEKLLRLLATSALVLGLGAIQLPTAAGYGDCGCPPRSCPPRSYPSYPYGAEGAAPTVPGEVPSTDEGAAGDQADRTDQTPTQQTPTEQPQADQSQRDFQPATTSPASLSLASLSPGANTPMLGRMDQNSRLNLFDTQSAIPQTRGWYTFQAVEGYNLSTFFTFGGAPVFTDGGVPTTTADTLVHRVGFEYAFYNDFSVSFQAQYLQWEEVDFVPDDWTNPQVMLKYAMYQDCDSTWSLTLGSTLETSTEAFEINEDTTKLYPGVLFHEQLYSDFFLQGGFQFGLATDSNQVDTFDWALGAGYWLYQAPCRRSCGCSSCGCGCGCGDCCNDCCDEGCCCCGSIKGVVAQVEVLGKHVVGDNTIIDPFDLETVFGPGTTIFVEDRNVLDLTLGATVMMDSGWSLGSAVSFPITGGEARRAELIGTLGYGY